MAIRPTRFALIVILLSVAAWYGLDSLRPRADWVMLECPGVAIRGRAFPVHLRLVPPFPPGRLAADLHAQNRATGKSRVVGVFQTAVIPGQTEYVAEIPLRADTTSDAVRVVVHLSPNGAWKDRSHSATTEDIPLRGPDSAKAGEVQRFVRRAIFNLGGPSTFSRVRSTPVRLLTSALWFVTGVVAATRMMRVARASASSSGLPLASRSPAGRAFWIACFVAALTEATDVSRILGEGAREVARRFAAYDSREPGQQIITALALALSIGAALAFLRERRSPPSLRFAHAAVCATLGIVCLDSLSLHAFDEIAESVVFGIPLIQIATLTCALTASIAVSRLGMRSD